MEKLFILCKVDILFPDGEVRSHVDSFFYVVKPEYFDNFTRYLNSTYDFVGVRKLGHLISSNPDFVHGKFSIL